MALHTELLPPTALTAPLRPVTARARVARRAPGGGRGGRRAAKLLVSGALATGIVALALPKVAGAEWADIATALKGLSVGQLAAPRRPLARRAVGAHAGPDRGHAGAVAPPGAAAQPHRLVRLQPAAARRRRRHGRELADGPVLGLRVPGLRPLGRADQPRRHRSSSSSCPALALCWLGVAGVEVSSSVSTAAYVGLGSAHRQRRWRSGWWPGTTGPSAGSGGCADRVVARVRFLPVADEGYAERAATFRRESAGLVAAGWGRMVGAKLAYAALQAVLLWACLRVVGCRGAPGRGRWRPSPWSGS